MSRIKPHHVWKASTAGGGMASKKPCAKVEFTTSAASFFFYIGYLSGEWKRKSREQFIESLAQWYQTDYGRGLLLKPSDSCSVLEEQCGRSWHHDIHINTWSNLNDTMGCCKHYWLCLSCHCTFMWLSVRSESPEATWDVLQTVFATSPQEHGITRLALRNWCNTTYGIGLDLRTVDNCKVMTELADMVIFASDKFEKRP
eukprot:5526569-Amphidinium_carterae.1